MFGFGLLYHSYFASFTMWRLYGRGRQVPPAVLAQLSPDDVVYCVFSGAGASAVDICLRSPVKRCVGIEPDQSLYLSAVARAQAVRDAFPEWPADRLEFRNELVVSQSLEDATVLYIADPARVGVLERSWMAKAAVARKIKSGSGT